MKYKYLILTVVILTMTSLGFSQGKDETPQQLATRVSKAFKIKKLGTLDAGKPYAGRVKMVVEHSLEDKSDTKSFSSMKLAGDWLFRGGRDVGVNAGNLQRCSNGTCTFTINGMLHNNLYLKKVTYAYSSGRPIIKTVHFVNGD
ncbi:MAG TPA: hypothetical protein PLP21_13760 [Pyrinomonadaceae bacterium]|nr:hypothetical protein [Acidobacteriota bacterium]HQZ97383.1 hypothetical protein [Pyrinomonadaceae bacterium]